MASPRWPNQFIILGLISAVQAYAVFQTNCSAPVTLSNYVSSPNTRGTLDILWSSLFTLFACTWSVQHPNIPKQRDADKETSQGWIRDQWKNAKWGLKSFYRSTLRMLSTVIAPELIIVAACSELLEARRIFKKMDKYASSDKTTWSLAHSYYANMGGFVVRNPLANEKIYHDPYHLNGEEVFKLRDKNHITKLPNMTEAEIKDKSKGDMLGKLIALGQITWSIIQIIARAVRNLPVSPLEVAVVAFAVCAVFMYILYWEKPQRVGVTQTIQLNDNALLYGTTIPSALNRAIYNNPRAFKKIFNIILKGLGVPLKIPLLGAPISVDWDTNDDNDDIIMIVASVSAALFGGIHAIAWNFAFPSRVELIFWRCASIHTAVAPLCFVVFSQMCKKFRRLRGLLLYPTRVVFALVIVSYPIARLFIIVEMFRTLFFLPPGSYISTWTSNIPHLA